MKDEATAISLLYGSFGDDDQALTDEYDTALQFWVYLRKKHIQIDTATSNIYIAKGHTFTFNSWSTFVGSWEMLKDCLRKLVAADADTKGAEKDFNITNLPH